MRSFLQRFSLLALGLVMTFVLLEVGIRLIGVGAALRMLPGAIADDDVVILCIGDSHTWGRGEGYPSRLAELLAERSDRYRVVNLGVPGLNTAQIRNRFAAHLDAYQPGLVIFWAGVNNAWNRAETELWAEAGVERASLGRRVLDASRVLRFIRVWRSQAALRQAFRDEESYVRPAERSVDRDATKNTTRITQTIGGREDLYENVGDGELTQEHIARVTALDLRFVIEESSRRDVPIVAVTYPLFGTAFGEANSGIRTATDAAGTLRIESNDASKRLLERLGSAGPEALYDPSMHPTQAHYAEIATVILEELVANDLLPKAD